MTQHHLYVSEAKTDAGLRRITRLVAEDGSPPVEIFHESAALPALTEDTPLDAHVMALLLYAMKSALPLHVHGPMTTTGLINLEEIQQVWLRWKPERYSHICILPDRVLDRRRVLQPSRAIAAFSGGADATLTALRHNHRKPILPDQLRYNLTDVLMVHGFDVDLDSPHFMQGLIERTAPLLSDLGLALRVIRTNSKDWQRQDWDDSHMLELGACLHMFAEEFDVALVGSGNPYDCFTMPWGSSPLVDPMITTDLMRMVHDGCGYLRSEKLNELARHPIACQTLKVCWAGKDQSGNCGHCEKCVRTMLNFLAYGNPLPACFPHGLDVRDIERIKIYKPNQRREFVRILSQAKAHGVSGEWMRVLERRLKWRLDRYEHPLWRRVASRLLVAFGLKAPLKRWWESRRAR